MTRIAPKPDKSVPLTLDGRSINQPWDDYFVSLSLSKLFDVSKTAPTNGQVLIWNVSTQKWTPGAN